MSYQENKLMNLKDGRLLLKTLDEKKADRLDLNGKSNDFAPVITNDFPEDIKVLENCAEGMGMGITIPISPVQDLHGYASPWVGGAGKNLLPKGENRAVTEITFTVQDNGEVVVTGTAEQTRFWGVQFTLPAGSYILNGCPSGGGQNSYYMDIRNAVGGSGISGINADVGSGSSFTLAEPLTAYVNIRIASGYACPSGGVKLSPMIRLASVTDGTYEPYQNLCPISGYTGVEITATGKNLLSGIKLGTINQTTGQEETGSNGISEYIRVKGGVTYTLSPFDTSALAVRIFKYDEHRGYLGTFVVNSSTGSFQIEIPSDTRFIRLQASSSVLTTTGKFQFEEGSIPTTYEPFGKFYPITWESAGTVYGGTVTINEDGSGVLTAGYEIDNLADMTWTLNQQTANHFWQSGSIGTVIEEPATTSDIIAIKSDILGAVSSSDIYSHVKQGIGIHTNGTIRLWYDGMPEDSTTFLNGHVIVYPLATHVTYNLTPQQITSLLGNTTVWNTIGNFSVSYHEDPKTYVDDTAGIAGSIAVTDSTEEAMKTMSDCADHLPMAIQVGIDPVQDLHGQASPYPAGTGKNLLPNNLETITFRGITFTKNDDGTYTLNGTNSGSDFDIYFTASNGIHDEETDITLPVGNYKFSAITGGSSSTYRLYIAEYETGKATIYVGTNDGDGSFTVTSGQTVSMFLRIYTGQSFSNMKIYPMIRLSTESDTFAPYSNLCPIIGWTGCNLSRTGKNLLTLSGYAWQNNTGAKVVDNGALSTKDLIATEPGAKFTYYKNIQTATNQSLVMRRYDANKKYIGNGDAMTYSESGSKTVTVANDTYFVAFTQYGGATTEGLKVQVEKGASFTGYETPQSETYSITFPDSAGTVYGGSLTVNEDGTGVLVADYAVKSYTGGWMMASDVMLIDQSNVPIGCRAYKCNMYECDPTFLATAASTAQNRPKKVVQQDMSSNPQHTRWLVYDTNYTNADSFNAYIAENPIQIFYKLATPVTYNLTAQQIRSLFGTVNLFADCGNILAVSYHADTKMYIDNLFATIVNGTGVSF